MLDIAWEELAVILAVALVVIGPKDMPAVLRTAGQWMRKLRTMSGEFHRTIEAAIEDAELSETRETVRKISKADLGLLLHEQIDPDGEIKAALQPPSLSSDPFPARDVQKTADKPDREETTKAGKEGSFEP